MKQALTILLVTLFIFSYPQNISKRITGKTFNVADVKEAGILLPDTNLKCILENHFQEKIICLPEESEGLKTVSTYMNGFLQAVHDCYDDHRPLVISPDDIWLLICQGFAIHLNTLPDSAKNAIFNSNKKKIFEPRIDELITNKCIYWKQYIDYIAEKIKEDSKEETYNLIVQDFSTTTSLIETAYKATLLEAFQKNYSYLVMSGCGIPKITLNGIKEDWENIYTKVDGFKKYGLDEWIDQLKPVLKEFCNAYSGDVDKNFWNRIYKTKEVYTTTYLTGWIIKFFPYIKDFSVKNDSTVRPWWNHRFKYIPNKYLKEDDYVFSELTTYVFPSGYTKTPITWINYFNMKNGVPDTIPVVLYSGFLGVTQSPDKSLSPLISWAVTRDSISQDYHMLRYIVDTITVHKTFQWTTDIYDEAEVLPIYAPDTNNSFSEGVTFLLRYLKDSLRKEAIAENYVPENIWVEFIITWDGNVRDVDVPGNCENEKFSEKINLLLVNLPYIWSPAEASEKDWFAYKKRLSKVNYKMKLKIF